MALADRYKKTTNKSCVWIELIKNLTPEDKVTFNEMIEDNVSDRIILRLLRAEGYKTSNEAMFNHRNEVCKCRK